MAIVNWMLNRLKERSTWLGLIAIAAAAGVTLSPEQREAIIAVGLTLGGALSVFTPDQKQPDSDKNSPQWQK